MVTKVKDFQKESLVYTKNENKDLPGPLGGEKTNCRTVNTNWKYAELHLCINIYEETHTYVIFYRTSYGPGTRPTTLLNGTYPS